MKKFFNEFKKFIMRGNVVDLAVGIIIGTALSAIVTALTNQILMPLINWLLAIIMGGNGMSQAVTMLQTVYAADGTIDMAQSIYIDWGAFITAVINFVLIGFILFCIVKAINTLKEGVKKNRYEPLTKEEIRKLRREGKTKEDLIAAAETKKFNLEQEAKLAAENAPKTEQQLLGEIVELLKSQKQSGAVAA